MQIFQTIILAINFYPTEIPNLRTTWKPWRKFNVNDRNNLLNLTHCTAVRFLYYQVLKIWQLAHYFFANFLSLISISINGEIIKKDDCTNFHSCRLTVLSTPWFQWVSTIIEEYCKPHPINPWNACDIPYNYSLLECILYPYASFREFLPSSDQS